MYIDQGQPNNMEELSLRQSAFITSPDNSRPWNISDDPHGIDENATDSDLYGDQGDLEMIS